MIFNLGYYCVKLKKEPKKPTEKKKLGKKMVIGALIAHVNWVPLALAKMRIRSQNLNPKKKKNGF